METLDRYPPRLLLSGLFILAILVHVWIISGMTQETTNRASITMKQTVRMKLRNTWKPPGQPANMQPTETAPIRPIIEKPVPRKPINPVEKKQQDQIVKKPAPIPMKFLEPEQKAQPVKKEIRPTNKDVQLAKEIVGPAEQPPPDLLKLEATQDQPAETLTSPGTERIPPQQQPSVKQQEGIDVDWNKLIKQYIEQIDILDYYPSRARRKRQQGIVIICITLSKEARVKTVAIDRSSRYASLDKAALELIQTNRRALEKILGSKKLFLKETVQLRLPIRFALR